MYNIIWRNERAGRLNRSYFRGLYVKFFNFGFSLRLPAFVALRPGIAGRRARKSRALFGRAFFAWLGRRAQVNRALAGKDRQGRPPGATGKGRGFSAPSAKIFTMGDYNEEETLFATQNGIFKQYYTSVSYTPASAPYPSTYGIER